MVKNYSLSGVRRGQYKVEAGTDPIATIRFGEKHLRFPLGKKTFTMSPFTVSHFLEGHENFPNSRDARSKRLDAEHQAHVGGYIPRQHRLCHGLSVISTSLLTCPRIGNRIG